jgi:enoyl-CoA hydratase/carnithine racemase
MSVDDGRVRVSRDGTVATVWFDRPAARNALTTTMYEQFTAACRELGADASVRIVVFRGVGGKAFVAGTDIARFLTFTSPEEGVEYEREMETHLAALLAIKVPTLAVIEGYAVGGGLNIAAACDLRIATTGSRFGTPIARTLGNCLSMPNYARLLAGFGESLAKRMLLLGDLLDAEEARQAGFLARLVPADEIDKTAQELIAQLLGNAPLTLEVSKEAIRRLKLQNLPDGDDLVRRIYGSDDFKEGVAAFTAKTKPNWRGR